MSALCTASSNLLSLNDNDLAYLSKNEGKKPLIRDIDIQLLYKATFNILGGLSGSLTLPNWELSTTSFCSTCDFCLLLHQGIQRSLDSYPWPWKALGTLCDQAQEEKCIPLDVHVTLDKFAYVKDTSPWARGQQSLKTWNVYAVRLTGRFALEVPPPGSEVVVKVLRDELVNSTVELEFEMFADQRNELAKLLNVHRSPLDVNPLSEGNVENIKRWIGECESGHEWCSTHPGLKKEERVPFLPTRLLDVGTNWECEPRLILSASHFDIVSSQQETCQYMALSYCWGTPEESSRLLKTTHSTIKDRLTSIPISTMPLAFQDAVTVARTLAIRYIWIDSLCIIQDSPTDWQTESSRMASIFSSAHLTVVAAVGSSCHSSFLYRDPNLQTCTVLTSSPKLGISDGRFSLRPRRPRGTEKMSEIFNSKWITRGWTFQEERLARRVLMFGTHKFFLDCRTLERAEDTLSYRLRPDWVGSVCGIPEDENDAVRASKYSQLRSASDHWQTLVSHYSFRELSFAQDKLPAVSGIASKFSLKLGRSGYLAGLWREYLPHDLFWYAPQLCVRPGKWRAPSWSWASVERKIMYPFWKECGAGECEMFCSILGARVSVRGLDPFGAVSDGFLTIRGFVLEVKAAQILNRKSSLPQWSLCFDDEEIAHASPDCKRLEVGEKRSYQALLFGRCKASAHSQAQKPQARGLLLEKIEQGREGLPLYQRVGVFYTLYTWDAIFGPEAVAFWRRHGMESTIMVV
ncbi:hypothetical protein VTL71DRAFT_9755 [Oculimacula yallundae]|uniref:Heterokaryon incompatibility domain-containing protein n=1 Tax=Oculimacula yallundae TaxID=86028 RepID=A0ABR4BRY1_9HELO